jgi:hypothetical protein
MNQNSKNPAQSPATSDIHVTGIDENVTTSEEAEATPDPYSQACPIDILNGYWQVTLRRAGAQSVASILETGRLLTLARWVHGYRRWGQFVRDARLPFGERQAEMHIRISANAALADPRNHVNLPISMHCLYVLSALAPEHIQEGLRNGQIHLRTSISQAKDFAEEHPSPFSRRRSRTCAGGASSESRTEEAGAESSGVAVGASEKCG